MKVVDKDCNLDCSYCFYCKQKKEKRVMDSSILEKVISEICNYNSGDINFIWHGGEPLLAGIDFYKKAFKLQEKLKKPKQRISNSIQTNATLLNDSWAELFKEYGINVSISLDGPMEVHDRYRIFLCGAGSFRKVIKGIESLRRKSVEFSIISVVTSENAIKSEEIFRFLTSQQPLWISFVASMGVKAEDGIYSKYSIPLSSYIDFLITIFNLWVEDGDYRLKILPIETILSGFFEKDHRDYRLNGECKKRLAIRKCERNLVITPNGELKTCGFHGYDDLFLFGDIKGGLGKAINSNMYRRYKNHLQKIKEKCSRCEWYKVCYEGCPRDFYVMGQQRLVCLELHRLFRHIQTEIIRHQIQKEWH